MEDDRNNQDLVPRKNTQPQQTTGKKKKKKFTPVSFAFGLTPLQQEEYKKRQARMQQERKEREEEFEEAQKNKFVHSGPKTQHVSLAVKAAEGKRLIAQWLNNVPKGTSVITVMWDPETQQWYRGRSGHGQQLTRTPGSIVSEMKDLGVNEYGFGENCAEVNATEKAYRSGKQQQNLDGCYYISYNVAKGKYWGPCTSCGGWIRGAGGQYYMPNV